MNPNIEAEREFWSAEAMKHLSPDPELIGAVARGWCTEVNAGKEMDPDLAYDIARHVTAWLASRNMLSPLGAGVAAPVVPTNWKDAIYEALNADFALRESSYRDSDGQRGGLRTDDTQIGVEWAMEWFERNILNAAPTLPEAAAQEGDSTDDLKFKVDLYKKRYHEMQGLVEDLEKLLTAKQAQPVGKESLLKLLQDARHRICNDAPQKVMGRYLPPLQNPTYGPLLRRLDEACRTLATHPQPAAEQGDNTIANLRQRTVELSSIVNSSIDKQKLDQLRLERQVLIDEINGYTPSPTAPSEGAQAEKCDCGECEVCESKHFGTTPTAAADGAMCQVCSGINGHHDECCLAVAPLASSADLEALPWLDRSTADPIEKARRVLKEIHKFGPSFFFDDGHPRDVLSKEVGNVLRVLETLATPTAAADGEKSWRPLPDAPDVTKPSEALKYAAELVEKDVAKNIATYRADFAAVAPSAAVDGLLAGVPPLYPKKKEGESFIVEEVPAAAPLASSADLDGGENGA